MANYKYTALTYSGEKVDGVIQAADQSSAIIELKNNYATVEKIKEVEETPKFLKNLFRPKVDEKNLALICKQFSIILNAGLPVTTAIKLVAEQTEDKYLKQLLLGVAEDVKGGSSLADSFEKRDERLPNTFIETIRAGEASGKIDTAFERLANYFSKKSTVAEKVKSALIYPAFVIVLGIAVVIVIMVYAVPLFTSTFEEMDIELPLPTKILIATSNFFTKWLWLIVLIAVILVIVYLIYRSKEEGHYNTDKWKLKVPILGKVRMMSASSEFSNSFEMMMSAGLPVIKSLQVTGKSLSNYSIGRDVEDASKLVEGGYRIGESLKKTTDLPNMLTEVIGIGEESGTLESVLKVTSEYYDAEAESATTRAIKILEPSIILVLAVFVVFILLAVYLPMFSLYSGI